MIAAFLLIATAIVLLGTFLASREDAQPKPRSKPVPRHGRSVHVDLPEIRAAVHEAGHAVSIWCCTLVTRVKHVTVGSRGDGNVVSEYFDLQTPSARWCHLVILLAGPSAEAMVYARGRSRESTGDLMCALEHAEAIGAEPPPWKRHAAGPTFDFEKLYAARPSDAVLQNLKEGYRMARHVVRSNETRLYRVVSLLLAKKRVSHGDLEPILGSRLRMRFMLPFGPKFILPHDERRKS